MTKVRIVHEDPWNGPCEIEVEGDLIDLDSDIEIQIRLVGWENPKRVADYLEAFGLEVQETYEKCSGHGSWLQDLIQNWPPHLLSLAESAEGNSRG